MGTYTLGIGINWVEMFMQTKQFNKVIKTYQKLVFCKIIFNKYYWRTNNEYSIFASQPY